MANRSKQAGKLKSVKIAQFNAQNSKSAIDEVRQIIVEKKIDVIVLQEPYNSKGLIRGLGITQK